MTKIKIVLDIEDFKTLVSGNKIARLKTDLEIETEIMLKDIGYDKMLEIIFHALSEMNKKNNN